MNGNSDISLTLYCDADWAGDIVERKSTTGYVVFIGKALVAWSSKTQKCIALSTTEAEYIALAETSKEAIWLCQILNDLG